MKFLNIIKWTWERSLFYIKKNQFPPWPYQYRHLSPYYIFKYYSTLGFIDLEKVVVGEIYTKESLAATFQWQTGQWDISHRHLLKNSIFVEFLKIYGGKQTISEEELVNSSYYKFMLGHFNRSGSYHGIKEPSKLVEQANYFLKLYHSIIDGSYNKNQKSFYKEGSFRSYSKYPSVIKINKEYWGTYDGHHRLAALYCLKNRWVRAHIIPNIYKIIWNQ